MNENDAWARYYRDYAQQLFRYAVGRVGNHHDAEDIIADAFVRAAGHLDRLEGNPAYLYTIVRNLVYDKSRRTGRETLSSDTADQATFQIDLRLEEDPERAALLAQDQVEVWQALDQLTPDQREAIELRYFGELDSAAIGKVIGKTAGAVDVLTCRARLKLSQQLRLAQVDSASLPEQCLNEYIPRLSAHLDGRLKSPLREQTLVHLYSCEHCQSAYAAMQETGRRLRVLLPPVLTLPDLTNRIEAQLTASVSAEEHGSGASSRHTDGADRSARAASDGPVRGRLARLGQQGIERTAPSRVWLQKAFDRMVKPRPERNVRHIGTTVVMAIVVTVFLAFLTMRSGSANILDEDDWAFLPPSIREEVASLEDDPQADKAEDQPPADGEKSDVGDRCRDGYVRRQANSGDHVCVTPQIREQTREDNSEAPARRDPHGKDGPDTCRKGYVWREAFPGDHVCVTQKTRNETKKDNEEAPRRIVKPGPKTGGTGTEGNSNGAAPPTVIVEICLGSDGKYFKTRDKNGKVIWRGSCPLGAVGTWFYGPCPPGGGFWKIYQNGKVVQRGGCVSGQDDTANENPDGNSHDGEPPAAGYLARLALLVAGTMCAVTNRATLSKLATAPLSKP